MSNNHPETIVTSISSSLPPLPDPAAPRGYRLIRRIGQGGMGDVYAAIQTTLGRTVAVKYFRPDPLDRSDLAARFRSEAIITAGLSHENIVSVIESGEVEGRPYLVLEFVSGGTLQAILQKGPLMPVEAAKLIRTIAGAIQTAHDAGILHRDLKPGNILMTPACVPKISDFGLSKFFNTSPTPESGLTVSGAILGTPSYMSPEQANGQRDIGPASDVYSLGAILYECLTGRAPFRAASILETMELVRHREPVRPRLLIPGLPRDLETICLHCLQKIPSQRYGTAADLEADLVRFLTGEPIRARPASRLTRVGKWIGRYPAAAALVATVMLIPILALTAVVYHNTKLAKSLVQEMQQRERADRNYRSAREAITKMLLRTAEHKFSPIPELRELERAQAEDALAFFREAISDDRIDQETKFELAEAVFRLARRMTEVSEPNATIVYFQEAQSAFDSLVESNPDDLRFRTRQAFTRGLTGFTLLNVDPKRAESELRSAIALYAGLHRDHPQNAELAHRLGQFTHNLGTLRRRAGRLDDATTSFRQAVEAHEAGMAIEQPTTLRRTMLADSLNGLGIVAWQAKKYSDAENYFLRVDSELTKALVADPNNLDAALTQGSMFINFGLVANDDGRLDQAHERFTRAIAILTELYRREPKLIRLRLPLYNAYGARSQIEAMQKRYAEAAADVERQIPFAAPDRVADSWHHVVKYWIQADHPQQAIDAARQFRSLFPALWTMRWAGWQTDPDFATIRGNPSWQELGSVQAANPGSK